ncbi:cytochrome P450 [Cladochytrium replicatum]|nr:cytochrome P450 [Cladochytrium replicatum]
MLVIATVVVSIVTALAVVLSLDPTRLKRHSPNGKILSLPPLVPWTFILPRIASVRQLLFDIKRHYGDLSYIHIPFRGSLLIALGNDASKWFHKDLKYLFAVTSQWEPKFPQRVLDYGELIRAYTRALNQEFYMNIQTTLTGILRKRVADWTEGCQRGETIDAFKEGHNLVLDVNAKVMFGNDWDEKDLADYKQAFLITDPAVWLIDPLNHLFPFRGRKIRKKWGDILIDVTVRHAQKHLDQGIKPNESSLDVFLDHYPNATVAGHLAWSLQMASYVTTGTAASWLLYHLAADEKLRERVRKEMRAIVPAGQELSVEHLSKLHFIDSLVREVIRYHAPSLSVRAISEDMQYNGLDIPKSNLVMFMHATTHFDEKIFENPSEFIPERFLDEKEQFDGGEFTRDCKLVVFGAGRHPCLGMRLACNELKLLTYELLKDHDLRLASEPVLSQSMRLDLRFPRRILSVLSFLIARKFDLPNQKLHCSKLLENRKNMN